MSTIKSFDELKKLVSELKPNLSIRDNVAQENNKIELLVCGDTGCRAANSMPIIDSLNEEINKAGLQDKVSVSLTGCFGFCAQGPIVKVHPDNVFYVKVSAEDAKERVQEHLVNGNLVERLLMIIFLFVSKFSGVISLTRVSLFSPGFLDAVFKSSKIVLK